MRYPMKSAPFKEDGKVIGHGVYEAGAESVREKMRDALGL